MKRNSEDEILIHFNFYTALLGSIWALDLSNNYLFSSVCVSLSLYQSI